MISFGSTGWYILLLMAGLTVGVAIAIARIAFRKDDE